MTRIVDIANLPVVRISRLVVLYSGRRGKYRFPKSRRTATRSGLGEIARSPLVSEAFLGSQRARIDARAAMPDAPLADLREQREHHGDGYGYYYYCVHAG